MTTFMVVGLRGRRTGWCGRLDPASTHHERNAYGLQVIRGRAIMRLRPWSGWAAWGPCPAAVMGLVLAGASGPATAAEDRGRPAGGEAPGREVFERDKVWQVHVALAPKEYEA